MSFVHDDPEFGDLIRVVAAKRRIGLGLVEKDYWVTHSLWALHRAGVEVWFKGGTSLSKGFQLIERFSEDLDLKIAPGPTVTLPAVSNWKSDGRKATAERKTFFTSLLSSLAVPGAETTLDEGGSDEHWRNAAIRVTYPGRHLGTLAAVMKPFVLLEVGNARVTPFVSRDITSFVHDELVAQGQLDSFAENRPKGVRCVHPLVTLLEKLDALQKRVPNENVEPAAFVRHFEDSARIIAAHRSLPPLDGYATVRALAEEMLDERQIARVPTTSGTEYLPADEPRWASIRAAHEAIAPMFWGERVPLEAACSSIRSWVGEHLAT